MGNVQLKRAAREICPWNMHDGSGRASTGVGLVERVTVPPTPQSSTKKRTSSCMGRPWPSQYIRV